MVRSLRHPREVRERAVALVFEHGSSGHKLNLLPLDAVSVAERVKNKYAFRG
jgi:hypothetical protein